VGRAGSDFAAEGSMTRDEVARMLELRAVKADSEKKLLDLKPKRLLLLVVVVGQKKKKGLRTGV